MNKLSAEQRKAVLADVPNVLRKVAHERDLYKAQLEAIQGRATVEKLASAMIEKGVRTGTVNSLADELEKEAAAGDIDLVTTARAVELVGTDMGKRAHVNDEVSGSSGGSDLERYMMS